MSSDLLYPTRFITHPNLLHHLPLGLKNFKLLPHKWQNHIRPIKTKFNVDMRRNWPLVVKYSVGPVFVNLRQLGLVTLGQVNMPHSMPFTLIALFLNLGVTLYQTYILDDFDFHIVNFPFLSSNIPSGPSYGVYISQLIRYARCCSHYDDFRYRHK